MLLRPSRQRGASERVCVRVCTLSRACPRMPVCIAESERQQDRDGIGSLVSYNRCMSKHVFVSLCLSQVQLPSRLLVNVCLSVS